PRDGGRGQPGDLADAEQRGIEQRGRAAGAVAAVIDGEGGRAGPGDEHSAAYTLEVAAQGRAVAADKDRVLAAQVVDFQDTEGALDVHRIVAARAVDPQVTGSILQIHRVVAGAGAEGDAARSRGGDLGQLCIGEVDVGARGIAAAYVHR